MLFRHERRCSQPRQIENRLHRAREGLALNDQPEKLILIQRHDTHEAPEDQHFILEQELIPIHQKDFDEIRIIIHLCWTYLTIRC